MNGEMPSVSIGRDDPSARRRALVVTAGYVILIGFALYSLAYLLSDRVDPIDFHVYRDAAEDIAAGTSPYPEFAYPPFPAIAAVPFTYVSAGAADLAVRVLLIVALFGVLALLGVRDWRCYALALLWPAAHAAIQTGNITIPLMLGAAVVWRFRDRAPIAGLGLGGSVAAKFYSWPLWLWLAATGRRAAAAWSIAVAVVVTLVTWAAVDFGAMFEYPSRLSRLNEETAGDGYTLETLAVDLGAGEAVAKVVMAVVALALLVSVVVVARRGAEMRSFVLTIAATLACSPILWLHYFALLLVPVAIVRPRLGLVWFLPLGMWWFGAGTGNGTTAQAVVVLAVAVATLVLAYRAAPPGRSRPVSAPATAPTPSLVAGRPR